MCPTRSLFALWLLLSLSPAALLGAAEPNTAIPFLRHRDRTLEYPGPPQKEPVPPEVSQIRIGWFGPSDLTNDLGGAMWWAACQAVQEANDQGGLQGRPFQLLPRWADNPWGSGVRLLTRLAYQDQVRAILGSLDSPSTHLAEQVVAKARLPLLSPVSTDKSVNLAGVPWMFSCAPADDQLAELLLRSLTHHLPDRNHRWILCTATDHDSRMATREILQAADLAQRTPSHRFDFPPATSDFSVQLEAIQKASPHAILISANPIDAARLAIVLRQRGLNCPLFGTARLGQWPFLAQAGPAAEGTRLPLLFHPARPDPATRQFVQAFQDSFHREPDYTAALTYDATRLLIEAVRQGGFHPAHIRQALLDLSPWPGVAGPIQFDGTGQNTRPILQMGVIHQGRLVPDPSWNP